MAEPNLDESNMSIVTKKQRSANEPAADGHSRPESSHGLSPTNPKVLQHARSNEVRPLSGLGRASANENIPNSKLGLRRDVPEINVTKPRFGSIN